MRIGAAQPARGARRGRFGRHRRPKLRRRRRVPHCAKLRPGGGPVLRLWHAGRRSVQMAPHLSADHRFEITRPRGPGVEKDPDFSGLKLRAHQMA